MRRKKTTSDPYKYIHSALQTPSETPKEYNPIITQPSHRHRGNTFGRSMGRQNNDDTVLCSSIALLQERFRRLQQIKEMRKERQVLQLTAEAEQPKWFFHHDLKHPSRPLCSSPSLQSEYHVNCAGLQSFEISLSLGLWSNSVSVQASVTSDETEVDTSLHL